MGDTPKNQASAEATQGQADNDSRSVVGPPSTAIPEKPPTAPQCCAAKKKCRWTQDPGMFTLTLLGLIALIVYTCYTRQLVIDGETFSAAQAKITRDIMRLDQRAWLGIDVIAPVP